MSKIIENIHFHTAYGSQVRLHEHYYDEEENQSRLSGYMPIRSHREAFLTLAASQLPDKNNKEKVFMLTGSYGTGKSHLCLMLANYFSSKLTSPGLASFIENWKRRDKAGAERMQNIRGDGRYLVAICDFGTAKPFEDMVLTGIEEALMIEGANDISINSRSKSALRWIETQEQRRDSGDPTGTFTDFMNALTDDDVETGLENLKKCLSENSSQTVEQFQKIYKDVTGTQFSFSSDSLQATVKDLLLNPDFKKRYKGLVILADEFGYALSENKVPIGAFQAFAEMSKDGVGGMPVIFIGVGHRRFESYAAGTALQADFRTVRDRVTEVSLQAEELEQIIAALISPDEQLKKDIEKHWLFTKMAGDARKANLFNYLSEPELLDQIVCNIYPMHPIAVYCLTKMSQELGSAARSVFSFFRQSSGANQGAGGYNWFVENNEIFGKLGEYNIYTPDLLMMYFDPEIVTTNTSVRPEVHDQIRNYRFALEEAGRIAMSSFTRVMDELTKQVLDTIFVLRISGIPVTAGNMIASLNLHKPEEKRALEVELNALVEKRVIFMNTSSREFEFRRNNTADLDGMIARCRVDVGSEIVDLAAQLVSIGASIYESWTVGQGHNANYQADKRLKRIFANPQDLAASYTLTDGSQATYWQKLEQDRISQKNSTERYEGTMVYVVCETEDDILNAQQAAKSNPVPSIIIGVPLVPIAAREKILDLLAIIEFMRTQEYNKLTDQEKGDVEGKIGKEQTKKGCIGEVVKVRDTYLEATSLVWYHSDGKVLVSKPGNSYEPADILLNMLFIKRNTSEHNLFNLSHSKFAGGKDPSLREAVKALVSFEKPVAIDANDKESQGEIRYLKNVLVKNGVLTQTGDYTGSSANYQLTANPDSYGKRFPALADLVQKLRNINKGEKVDLWPYLMTLIEKPYGIGPYALSLFLAVAIRYLGDEIRVKLNPVGFGFIDIHEPEIVIDIATGKYSNTIVERLERTEAVVALVDGIHKAFSKTPANAGVHYTQGDAWRAMLDWWKERTHLEQTSGIYPEQGTARKLAQMLAEIENISTVSQIFLDKLKVVYGYSEEAELDDSQAKEIIKKLNENKGEIENHAGEIRDNIIHGIGRLFVPEGNTFLDYQDAIRNWVNDLHPDQKLKNANWQTQQSITLIEALPTMTDIKQMLLDNIPVQPSFGFGKVNDWGSDKTEDFVQRFREALAVVNNGLPKVEPPTFEIPMAAEPNPFGGDPVYKYHGSIDVVISSPVGVMVRVAKNEDPRTAKQFELVNSNRPLKTTITDSSSLQLVSQNTNGEFSKVVRVSFRNLNDDYKLIPEPQGRLEKAEMYYSFRNPVNPQGLSTLLRDLFSRLEADGKISREDLASAVKEAIKSYFGDIK